MLRQLGEHIANALERAAAAERRAMGAIDPKLRLDHEQIALSWRLLARSFQFVERLDSFLVNSRRGWGLRQPKAPDEED
jgi:hypothetical protein